MADLDGQRVLVTGGAGFIGSHLVDGLLARGARVRVLDNLVSGCRENLAHCLHAIDFVEGDIRDSQDCRRGCEGVSVAFHQAALGSVPRSLADPGLTVSVNVSGTANLFAAARDAKVARVIYASSSSIYGDSERLPKREGEEGRPLSPYALSKRMNEDLADLFGRCFGMELIGLRYFNVYGPRQDPAGPYAAVIPRFFGAYLRGEAPVIYGDGGQTRDFTFVADAVAANLLAARAGRDACGAAYNVAGGSRTSVRDLAHLVRDTVGGGPKPLYEPPRAGDVKHSHADLRRAGACLAYAPTVDLPSGLRKSYPHYADQVATGKASAVEPRSASR